ncbi:MAG: hypothetical protein UT92_C0001G0050 [Candidatus Curtissbacteria bacterium GW2011_GWA1_40_24]|uniref:Uncharacterized protein n=2 Tax=Patescibacteria group TaxID=1783273 RepID=A0A0G0UZD5_9BACT|nr:MAG: hypothetical protein UT92_C0001G0050 [Candidatus Curtissbacteria bacterium GW2011_GWA1_40_24]KKR89047.1 MAG: hypothetical protein UU38_C0002G0050 [Candidatus Wolfebacteria bacterium GW2011_GWB1_41_12]
MVGPLTLNQVILVRLQVPQPNINKSMLKIIGNDIVREGTKIGWISGNDIFDQGGNKIGYFTGDDIYDHRGTKIGYLESNYIKYGGGSRSISVKENRRKITGGAYSDICRAAIRLLLGI